MVGFHMKASKFPKLVRRNARLAHFAQAGLPITLNMSGIARALFCLGAMAIVGASSLKAQTDSSVDGVTVQADQAYSMRGDQLDVLTDVLKLPFEVEVTTNGTFTVAGGKERKLKEGQVIRSDGWILNPDGSVQPVFDHVGLKAGRVIVVRDDQTETLTEPMTFSNNLAIAPDGWCTYPSGSRARLADGQLFRMDGTSVFARDTATLKNGQVVLQKDGTLIYRLTVQITGMCDGTKVQGDGIIKYPDGTIVPLDEGQTVLLAGRASRH